MLSWNRRRWWCREPPVHLQDAEPPQNSAMCNRTPSSWSHPKGKALSLLDPSHWSTGVSDISTVTQHVPVWCINLHSLQVTRTLSHLGNTGTASAQWVSDGYKGPRDLAWTRPAESNSPLGALNLPPANCIEP